MKNIFYKFYNKGRNKLYQIILPKPRKALFDHLPKCGGSTLNAYLESNYNRNRIYKINGSNPKKSVDDFYKINEIEKKEVELIRGHLANKLINHVDDSFLVVTMLREPIDRIISHYYYAKRTKDHYLYTYINDNNISLKIYVSSEKSVELQNWYVSHFSDCTLDEIKKNPKQALKKALLFLNENYHIIGFTENFNLFTEELKRKAKYFKKYDNFKTNVSFERKSINEISDDTLNTIVKYNSLDIELYNLVKEKVLKKDN